MTGNRVTVVILSVFAIAALAAVVLVAIGLDRLGVLIVGVFAFGVISVSLAIIGVNLYSRMSASRAEREELLYHHAEAMAKHGIMIIDQRALSYERVTLQIAAPAASKLTTPANEHVNFSSADPRALAVNLLLFSVNLGLGESNRLASAPECAGANIVGYSARKRDYAVRYLEKHYGIVTQQGSIESGGGTFVPDADPYGVPVKTVNTLYKRLLRDDEVNALPGVTR